ncbi:MAG: VWA domain-containing protein [Methanomicrobiales archaeon]|nr:VWA domain-containing protein [Methanomicrobiales archaeon]
MVGALLLVSCAGAAIPDHMSITGDDWMIADSLDTSPVTVTVRDAGNAPVEGATVTFQIQDPWQMTTDSVLTGPDGTVTSTVKGTTVSGTAPVTITAQRVEGGQTYTIDDTYAQKIDHTAPVTLFALYPGEITVGTTTPLVGIMVDRYLNPCDNRRNVEWLTFSSTSPEPALWDGSSFVSNLTVPCNETGMAAVSFRVDRVGINYVVVEGPAPIPRLTIPITGIPDGYPTSIQLQVLPDGDPHPQVIADGTSRFLLTYHLYDSLGNPAGNRDVVFITSLPGETSVRKTTNSDGIVQYEYGPKQTVGLITVTAWPADNDGIFSTQALEFVSGDPVAMLLTASPQSMASRDYNDAITSRVSARVVDVKGNPVSGETVTFRMTGADNGTYIQTEVPALELGNTYEENLDVDLVAVTGEDGIASVTFHPGAFLTDRRVPGWSSTATGTAVIQATWNGVPHTITMTWKNYPYLSVQTVVPPKVYRDGLAQITVRVRGDGWALMPDPIDVVLVTDRSGSMLSDTPDRMHSVREAAKLFVTNMTLGQDEVGLVSFGRNGYIQRPGYNSGIRTSEIYNTYIGSPTTYADYATLDRPLGTDLDGVTHDLDYMVPDHGTPMRKALKVAIDELIANARPETVAAIVILSDGDYNWFGDPLARGTGNQWSPTSYGDLSSSYYTFTGLGSGPFSNQNMSQYAKSHGIKIFTIAYGGSLSTGGQNSMRYLAEGSGGKYYEASASNIGEIYTAIAGELHNEAGVDTAMNLDFNDIEVNTETFTDDQVFEYQYIDSPVASALRSTRIYSELGSEILEDRTFDQGSDWADHMLTFPIGTIRLNQVWEANYTVKVLKVGQIRVFDSSSTITFNNGQTVTLPDTYLTVLSPDGTGALGKELHITNLAVTTPQPVYQFADIGWDLSYTGSQPITETIERSMDNGMTWVLVTSRTVNWDPAQTTIHEVAQLDLRSYLDGEYLIRVSVHADDAPDDRDSTGLIISALARTAKIRIG